MCQTTSGFKRRHSVKLILIILELKRLLSHGIILYDVLYKSTVLQRIPNLEEMLWWLDITDYTVRNETFFYFQEQTPRRYLNFCGRTHLTRDLLSELY